MPVPVISPAAADLRVARHAVNATQSAPAPMILTGLHHFRISFSRLMDCAIFHNPMRNFTQWNTGAQQRDLSEFASVLPREKAGVGKVGRRWYTGIHRYGNLFNLSRNSKALN